MLSSSISPKPTQLATAVCNFVAPFPILPSTSSAQFLPFYVGERLQIISHCDNWCFGYFESDPNQRGIFPSSFVEPLDETLPDEDINRRTSSSIFYSVEESKILLAEITETLKAWWKHLKACYSRGIPTDEFDYYVELIIDLTVIRKKILSGNVPTEELRELRHASARKIDLGNHQMGLGMHIRDEASRILRIDKLSVVEAYREHERAFAKITSDTPIEEPQTTALIITMNQADFKLEYNCELTLLLWDNEAKKPLTESVVFKWEKKSNKFGHQNLNAMFVGLSDRELMKDSLELAASLTVIAPIDIALAAANGKPLKISGDNNNLRQPLAESKIKLADKLRDIADKEKRELRLSFNALLPVEKYQSNRKSEIYIEFSIQRLTGPTLEEIRLRHPEIFTPKPASILRLQLPSAKEVIEEERNEIYLKLGAADLHGGKHSDKNIEAYLKVYDDEGAPQTGCFPTITPDGRVDASLYRSRVFCLTDRPVFEEMIKISLPAGLTRDLHLRILFFHRRTFDKAEKGPFALAYLRLIHKGVLEKSTFDELLVYKIEKYEERKVSYLCQCSTKSELKVSQKNRPETSSFVLNEKNSLTFETTVISCIHTTDYRLRSILSHKERHREAIGLVNALLHSDEVDEIIKFLPDFMDSLFQILSSDVEANRRTIFNALVYVIRVCDDPRYQSYLDNYLNHFHAANVFKPLLVTMTEYLDISHVQAEGKRDQLLPVLRTLGYLTKIIIKSKECHDRIFPETWADITEDFMHFLGKIKELIQDDRRRMVCQNAAVKYLPAMFPPLIESCTLSPLYLAHFVMGLIDGFSKNITVRGKISFLSEIVATDLFLSPDCLSILLPRFLEEVISQIRPYVAGCRRSDFESETYLETVELCATVLSDIVEKLFPFSQLKSVYQTGVEEHLQLIVTKTVRVVNQTVISLLPRDPVRIRPVHALNLALLNKFSTSIFINFLGVLPYSSDRKDILLEMLHMFRDLLEQCPFPSEWYQMRYLQFKMFMKHIRFIKAYILRYFSTDTSDLSLWQVFFKTVSVIVQKIVPNEDTSIYNTENRLMRKAAALIIRSMWLSLEPLHKPLIIDKVLGDILLVTLVDDVEIREAMIPVFYDMLLVDRPDDHSFVDEFIMHLDPLVDRGLGNVSFRQQLRTEFNKCCSKEDLLQLEFVERIDRLLGLLLNLRQVRNDAECVESGKYCLVQLVNFYASINQHELKVHHLHNLYAAHLESDSEVEAAVTLKRFAEMLEWSAAPVPSYITKRQYDRGCATQAALRETLFVDAATLFEKGDHWEKAIDVLKQLIPVYEGILFNYGKLADLHRQIGTLYDKISKDMRVESYYFLVAFYGKGFPEYLANKKFVFRGKKLEMLAQFKEDILGKYYGAQFIESVDNRDDLATADGKFIQIIPVTPMKSSRSVQNPHANALVRWYSKYHDVFEFEHLRSERLDDTKWTKKDLNDATRLWIRRKIITISHSLPGILNFAAVENTYEPEPDNPVEVAIQKIDEVNENLRETAELVAAGFNSCVTQLGGWLRGVLQADVGGGIKNYESFFTDEIKSEATPSELKAINRLSRIFLHHVTIIEYCLAIHASKPHLVNENFHAALVDLFLEYRGNVEKQFGTAPSMLHSTDTIHLPASGALTSTGISTSSGNFTHASSSSLSLDDAADKQQSVLLRAVPGAATLLRTTMSRSKLSTPNKKSTGALIPMDSENSTHMLQTLRELASHDILASPEPRDDEVGDFPDSSPPPPPLPPRQSTFHGPPISVSTANLI